jgi:hypothetical protein
MTTISIIPPPMYLSVQMRKCIRIRPKRKADVYYSSSSAGMILRHIISMYRVEENRKKRNKLFAFFFQDSIHYERRL